MRKKYVFDAETKEGWLVEPMVKFKIKIYQDKGKIEQKGKDLVLDFLGLYFKDDGDSLPSLRFALKNDEAKRFAETILQLIS